MAAERVAEAFARVMKRRHPERDWLPVVAPGTKPTPAPAGKVRGSLAAPDHDRTLPDGDVPLSRAS